MYNGETRNIPMPARIPVLAVVIAPRIKEKTKNDETIP